MSFITKLGKPFTLAAIFTMAALAIEHDAPQPPQTNTPDNPVQGCHGMIVHQLGLFKEYEITLSGNRTTNISQWVCPDEYKMTAFQALSRESFPALHKDFWDKDGAPVPITVTRRPL